MSRRLLLPLLVALPLAAADPLKPAPGEWSLLLFLLGDCPISRRMAPEIRRICLDYAPRGVHCTLVMVDTHLSRDAAAKQLAAYSLDQLPFVIDHRFHLVKSTGATVTPEAVLLDSSSNILYRGRIDDSHPSWTQSRPATRRDLRNALDDALAGRPIRESRTKAVGCYITIHE
jgi:hypothetical protein